MIGLAFSLPAPSLVAADLLRLRKRGGLVAVSALLTIGAVVFISAVNELLHVVDSSTYGPAGGVTMLGHVVFVVSTLGAVAAAIVGSTAGAGDHEALVYREIVVTGRSRLALYASRIPAGLSFLLPFVAVAYAIAAVVAVLLAGANPLPTMHVMTVAGSGCYCRRASTTCWRARSRACWDRGHTRSALCSLGGSYSRL